MGDLTTELLLAMGEALLLWLEPDPALLETGAVLAAVLAYPALVTGRAFLYGRLPGRLVCPGRRVLGYLGGFETCWGLMLNLSLRRSGPYGTGRLLSVCLDGRGRLSWFSWILAEDDDCPEELHWPCLGPALRDFLCRQTP